MALGSQQASAKYVLISPSIATVVPFLKTCTDFSCRHNWDPELLYLSRREGLVAT